MSARTVLASLAVICLSGLHAVAAEGMRPPPRPGGPGVPDLADEAVDGAVLAAEPGTLAAIPGRAPVPRPALLMQGQELRPALAAARAENWAEARRLAAGDPVVADIVEWMRLRAGAGGFADYRAFLQRRADWPGLDLLRRKGEAVIPEGADPAQVIGYFNGAAPQTGIGALRLAQAHRAAGSPAQGERVIVVAWLELGLEPGEEAAMLRDYGAVLGRVHAERLDALLWRGDRAGAARMLPRVDAGRRALAEARLALQREDKGVNGLIDRVPAALRKDGGLSFDRAVWRIEAGMRDSAADLILEQSTGAEALGKPQAWGNWRRILARQELRAGNVKRAYELASRHFIPARAEDYDYSDLEWLAGFIALRHMQDPARALTHFKRFTASVYTPISLGRGYYWEGRALEAAGDAAAAAEAYRRGGVHQSSFYGLLAAEKAGMPVDMALTGRGPVADWRAAGFAGSSVLAAAARFFAAGEQWETVRFLSHLSEGIPEAELVALTDYALSLGDPYVAVRVAKMAAQRGVVAPRAYYPLTPLGVDLPVEEALALSIARRESEFNAGAVSPVGARGLMQLMPGTAQLMSKEMGLGYAASKLTSDPVYNATLGSGYLARLIRQYGKNYVLVSVGYNAGPGRADRWIEDYGDPRGSGAEEIVDWVENIPFRETRNYVMRVMESVPIYRARLTGEAQPVRLIEEMTGR